MVSDEIDLALFHVRKGVRKLKCMSATRRHSLPAGFAEKESRVL